jgi:hypothetical protein
MKKQKQTRVERLLDAVERRIAEAQIAGSPREWHWRAIQDGACQMLAAIQLDERRPYLR